MTHPTHILPGLLRRTTPGNRLAFRTHAADPFGLLDELFSPQLRAQSDGTPARHMPRMDVVDGDAELRLDVELPGMDEKDVELTIEDGVLTLRGEKKRERELDEGGRYRLERSYGSFSRSFRLPVPIVTDKVSADYKNGILRITLPKAEESRKRAIQIQIEN